MPATKAQFPSKAPKPLSRTSGFVLGATWPRSVPIDPSESGADPLHPASALANAPAVLQGILTHFVEPDVRAKLREGSDNLRLVEDLGLDSLTMIEIMMRVEDLLKIRVTDEQLRHFRTVGEVRQFVDRTAREMSAPLPAH